MGEQGGLESDTQALIELISGNGSTPASTGAPAAGAESGLTREQVFNATHSTPKDTYVKVAIAIGSLLAIGAMIAAGWGYGVSRGNDKTLASVQETVQTIIEQQKLQNTCVRCTTTVSPPLLEFLSKTRLNGLQTSVPQFGNNKTKIANLWFPSTTESTSTAPFYNTAANGQSWIETQRIANDSVLFGTTTLDFNPVPTGVGPIGIQLGVATEVSTNATTLPNPTRIGPFCSSLAAQIGAIQVGYAVPPTASLDPILHLCVCSNDLLNGGIASGCSGGTGMVFVG